LKAIVFTDLDGTLLDHASYSFEPAREALNALSLTGIPLILCSSKTRAEILLLQDMLGISGPFISENGGAVFLSGGGDLTSLFPEVAHGLPAKIFGRPYVELREALTSLAAEFGEGVKGFGDMEVKEVAALTGLGEAHTLPAMLRDFDEPFVWRPEPGPSEVEMAKAILAVQGGGLSLTRGGRFWHLMGDNDKGKAIRWLLSKLESKWGETPKSLALGDSENDLPMLLAVDDGVLVEKPNGGYLSQPPNNILLANGKGPVGWNKAVLNWIEQLRRS